MPSLGEAHGRENAVLSELSDQPGRSVVALGYVTRRDQLRRFGHLSPVSAQGVRKRPRKSAAPWPIGGGMEDVNVSLALLALLLVLLGRR